ncbi:MAG: sulfate/molybdate ABC transporter ATP-binding protein [Myxococcales bacterium]|jgi:sulfate transport system ATP-binding protein
MSVVVERLTKRFHPHVAPAVHEVSFEAPSGAITALLGPSGAGKSTVLRLIAGLERPDEGRVVIDGEDVTRRAVQKRGVGFVFQSYGLFDHMSVCQNIGFGLSVRRTKRAEIDRRVNELLSLIQLDGYGDRRPGQLSGGQRQRVAFARALAVHPRILLLDEPFGALDAKVRVELRDWLRQLHAETRITTLLVTHDQEEAFAVAERVVIILGGRAAQVGAPAEVVAAPASAQVAEFLVHARARAGGPVAPAVAGAASGTVVGVRRVGTRVRVMVDSPRRLEVELPASRFEALRIGEGDPVEVDPSTGEISPRGRS